MAGSSARIVFAVGIVMVVISYASVVFPAAITMHTDVSVFGIPHAGPDRYEAGVWAAPVIATGIMTLVLVILHQIRGLPRVMTSAFDRIRSFEVSRRVSLAMLAIIMIPYVVASVPELYEEEIWEDYAKVDRRLDSWSLDDIDTFEPHVRYFLIKASEDVFGNQKVVPFVASIMLLLVTYDLTRIMAGRRLAGIVATIITMQSSLFLRYDTSVTYTNFWILFYMISLYAAYRAWPLAPVSYLVSIPAKALTIAFAPMFIYHVARMPVRRRTRGIIIGAILGIITAGAVASAAGIDPTSGGEAGYEEFVFTEFLSAWASFAHQLRDDVLLVLFMIPLVVGLYYTSRYNAHAESIIVFIAGMLLLAPVLAAFTNQTNQPYRFMPLVVFFAMGVGVLISRVPLRGAGSNPDAGSVRAT